MDAAKQLLFENTEPLAWEEICIRYPDQYVCLIDIDHPEPRSPEITSARVVGNGPTSRAAFQAVRDLGAPYPLHAVRFTGVSTLPLIRPSLVIDDETLDLLRS
jgi:hypothetical protein